MIGLRGIHSFVSDPNLDDNHSKKYLEHILVTQTMSAWYWKKTNGPIHLYTTERDANFFRELKMLDIYDHVDTEVLRDHDDISWAEFGPAVKMKVVSSQKDFPFATIDNDLIFRSDLSGKNLDSDIIILHKEIFSNRKYPPPHFLGKREDYIFPEFIEKKSDPFNVCFVIWNNPKLIQDYWSLAYDYMNANKEESLKPDWASDDLPRFWKSLFVEQRLLSALVEHEKYKSFSLMSAKYSGDTGIWVDETGNPFDFSKVPNEEMIDFYHIWEEKSKYYLTDPPNCTGPQIFTLYNLIKSMSEIKDPLMKEILDRIISFTIQKTQFLGLDDLYSLKLARKYLIET